MTAMSRWASATGLEPGLLATRGKPRRLHADVRQGILEPRREHSRKPNQVYERIERLVAGPYLELFALQRRPGWTPWGDQVEKFGGAS
jgi:N6-adenosine-specific RNA methylase IME4